VHAQLEANARAVLRASVRLEQLAASPPRLRVTLPVQLLWHQADLGTDLRRTLRAVGPLLPAALSTELAAALADPLHGVEVRYTNSSWQIEFRSYT